MNSIDVNFLTQLQNSVSLFKPEFTLVAAFLVAIIFDLIFKKSKNISGIIAIIGLVVSGIFLLGQSGEESYTFSKMLVVDPFGQFFKFLILISSLIIVLISFLSKELYKDGRSMGEYFSLILGMTFGMFLISEAVNLIMIYLALEIMSITSYILAGYTKEIKRSSEASLKYVIFGAVSSGIMIYGISILYGLTGTLNLYDLNIVLGHNDMNNFALLLSGLMIIAGIGYKISAVPFHFWTPDVYEGAPVTVTAYLSVASKAAGFAVLIRFLKIGFIDNGMVQTDAVWAMMSDIDWKNIIAVLAVLSMTLGNLVAVWQTNMKRLLAYSSIAHAGYMLMGVTVMTDAGVEAVIIYFVMYLFMNLGAFTVIMLLANKIGSEDIEDYTGIGYRAPALSVCMVIFLISLTGLPPTAGFIGKLYIFTAVIDAGYIWLAVVGVINSVVSLYYYVKVFRNMFVRGVDNQKEEFKFEAPGYALVILLAIPTLLFGVYFTPILNWAKHSVAMLMG